jgi:hypothetical protein
LVFQDASTASAEAGEAASSIFGSFGEESENGSDAEERLGADQNWSLDQRHLDQIDGAAHPSLVAAVNMSVPG